MSKGITVRKFYRTKKIRKGIIVQKRTKTMIEGSQNYTVGERGSGSPGMGPTQGGEQVTGGSFTSFSPTWHDRET